MKCFASPRTGSWSSSIGLVVTLLVFGFAYSALRLVSVALLFMNDSRIPAGEYIAEIRGYLKSIEYTLYPPNIEKKRFMRAHNYPIYFVKYPDEQAPIGGKVKYNQGEAGLIERNVDYLVIDSFTYHRLYNDAICVFQTPNDLDLPIVERFWEQAVANVRS